MINVNKSSATAVWKIPDSSIYYILSIGTDKDASNGGTPYIVEKPHRVTWNEPSMDDLKAGTTYYIKLAAFNDYGLSDWSKPVQFTTHK